MKTLNMQKVMNRASTHGKASMARAEKAREEAKKRRELEEANKASGIPPVVEGTASEEEANDELSKSLIEDLGDSLVCFLKTYRKTALTDFDSTKGSWKFLVDEITSLDNKVPDLSLLFDRNVTRVQTYLGLAERYNTLNARQKDVRKNDPRIKLQPWDKAVVDAHHLADKAFSEGEKEIGKGALLLARDINVTH